MKKTIHSYQAGLQMLIVICILVTTPVPDVNAESGALEEITVTARKREENLQNVGIAISALNQTEIDRTFARDIKDLAKMSPNLIIDDTSQGPGGNGALYLRGIGVADVEKNFDPAVGVVIDGLYIGANSGAILRSIDLARAEVLRGPQGTLFGRNTIGGLFNFERTRPTGELGAKIKLGAGSYDTWNGEAIVNFGLGDKLAVKLSGAKHEQQAGYFENISTGQTDGEVLYESYGANLLYSVNDDLEFEYTYQDESTDQDTPPLLNTSQARHSFCSAPPAGFPATCSPSVDIPVTWDKFTVATVGLAPATPPSATGINFTATSALLTNPLDASFDTETHIVEGHWNVNDSYTLDYIFGHFETAETIDSSWTGTPDLMFGTERPAEYKQDSHELRLTYDAGDKLNFVVGAYYWHSDYEIRLRSWIAFAVPGLLIDLPQTTKQETDNKALFFEVDYALTDQWKLTVGGRYSYDDKTTDQAGVVTALAESDWGQYTPKVGLSYQMNEDLMFYTTYSEGYRSGGFNGRVGTVEEAITPYDPEFVTDYELGLKSQWLDDRLRFNANWFYMEYDDKQEELQLPSATSGTGQKTLVINAATATIWGIELEAQAYVTDNLSLRANMGYLNSEYDSFTFVDGTNTTVDFSGLEFRRAPDFTGTIDTTYEWAVAGGEAWVTGSYHFLGNHFVNITNDPEFFNPNQHLVDASINYAYKEYQVSVFGRNLLDEDGMAHGFDVAGLWSYGIPRAPRTFGVEVVYNYGD